DNLLLADPLYAVADGMGGHAAGEVASETAVQALESAWKGSSPPTPEALAEAARAANRAVWEKAQADADLRGMGTTLVAVALVDEQLAVINVGDSRAYRLRQGELSQLTSDHSLVAELVAEGQIHSDEAEFHPQRHVLTRALGVDANVGVDLQTLDVETGDRVLLCSDGLCREVSDDQIAAILRRLADPTEAAKEMVNEAKASGGNDNITVVVVDAVVVDAVGDAAVAAPTVGVEAAGVENDGRDATIVVAAGPGPVAGDPTVVAPSAEPTMPAPSGEPAAGAAELSRRQRRRQRREAAGPGGPGGHQQGPKARVVTVRVVAFFVLLLLVLAAGAAA
ncbi:MAG: Stp1/IreP family PP2C-type Ser/Thr phosphatase, partial [Actinomycetes bacterium]